MFRHLQRATGSTMWTECEGLYLRSSFHPNLCWIKGRQPHRFSARPRREKPLTDRTTSTPCLRIVLSCSWHLTIPAAMQRTNWPAHLGTLSSSSCLHWSVTSDRHGSVSFLGSQSTRHTSGCSSTVLSLSLTLSFPFGFFLLSIFSLFLSFLPPSFLSFLPSFFLSFSLSPSFTSHSNPKDPDYHLLCFCWENIKLNK